ncbi:uncharacterized protein LOC114351273 [Ostrinia furnacalis]|uniref:uncharacterized protein LOC114351273 n=1 Tax=Ostrinia furnacalis TaxID=93504 RepID=UPI00103EC947|nr:uncharacterized protein LOC114351273 [Ostrinia furnacalis]
MVKTSNAQNLLTRSDKSISLSFDYFYPLDTTTLTVFKKSKRQSIKLCFNMITTRYFELGQWSKRRVFWKLWCIHVVELNTEKHKWPFVQSQNNSKYTDADDILSKKKTIKWTDKYLYLGSKREAEDNNRPKPVPGLGPPENIKLLYLKQKYFGCWDQSEHWVQCDSNSSSHLRDK